MGCNGQTLSRYNTCKSLQIISLELVIENSNHQIDEFACCLLVQPFIEEFSHHPMPDNCGAGNTEVKVNGRELHKRDLELLAGRGLPRDKNRSYILDISGRILDGESGEELKSLGKLAPT